MSLQRWHESIVPAHLAFLAIYNPSLGPTDETFQDQVVFYFSRSHHEARKKQSGKAGEETRREEENEKLRQIGLAQGMVEFARTFSNGSAVDFAETEKARVIMHELENGWWALASINITQLPKISSTGNPTTSKDSDQEVDTPSVEYSAREVAPPTLLLQQLLHAYYIFCLHHGPSLSDLYVRLTRDKFCAILDRYWTRFCRSWDVLLHGNPAVDILSGIKVAAGGELGIGVGEEEHGSGERAVLEDMIDRTEGLVDVLVSRFEDQSKANAETGKESSVSRSKAQSWIGSSHAPSASDGVIFSGSSERISTSSLRDLALWMRHIFTYGERAYGIRDNPHRERRKRRRRNASPSGDGGIAIGMVSELKDQTAHQIRLEDTGYFLIGLQGNLMALPDDAEVTDGSFNDDSGGLRTMLRTLQIEVKPQTGPNQSDSVSGGDDSNDDDLLDGTLSKSRQRLRVIVYARRPFLYCFLFEQRTSSLAYAKFYQDLHATLAPIHKPLLRSTGRKIDFDSEDEYKIRVDFPQMAVHCSVPNIPDPTTQPSPSSAWTRMDALSVYHQILNCFSSRRKNEYERATKSNRGWWVQWTALPSSSSSDEMTPDNLDRQERSNAAAAAESYLEMKVWKGSDPKGVKTVTTARVASANILGWLGWWGKGLPHAAG